MEDELGAKVGLISGSNGVFEIHADGRPIFSKKQTGRFPQDGEIVTLLKG